MTDVAAIDAITARRTVVEDAFESRDVELLASLITDDVVWCTAAGAPWFGRREVIDRIGRFFREYEYRFRFGPPQIDTDGRRAVDRTSFESRVLAPASATPSIHHGLVVVVWTDRSGWRISAYIDVSSLATRADTAQA